MNVFEDLIVELKEENLLERTITESLAQRAGQAQDNKVARTQSGTGLVSPSDELAFAQAHLDFSEDGEVDASHIVTETADEPVPFTQTAAPEPASAPIPPKPDNGKEFYRKRAVGELTNLQTVEHVLTGVEREYLKIVPKAFDDFKAKKALNSFLQVNEGENSPEHAEAEFNLMRETEAWCTSLSDRDRNIPVSAIRRYCENSRPALSSQALISLARFYRNLPYTEAVRGKFDFVMTRVFTKTLEDHKRATLFTRDEILDRINMLYREWSSIPLYSADEDESNIMLTSLSFEELALEAEGASSFDLLISGDFFGRMRMFKESISELFYAPTVTAAAIDCNIRVGNAYVDLIDRERQNMDAGSIKEKYGDVDEVVISDATSKTLMVGEFLHRFNSEAEGAATLPPAESGPTEFLDHQSISALSGGQAAEGEKIDDLPVHADVPFYRGLSGNMFRISPWLAIVCAALIIATLGIYLWSNQAEKETVSKAGVQVLGIDGTSLREHLSTARISGQTVYVMVEPSWNSLTREKRQEFLKGMLEVAKEKGCTQVNLLNKDGKAVGFASAGRIDVAM